MFLSPGFGRLQVPYKFLFTLLRFATVSVLLFVSTSLNVRGQSPSVLLSAPSTAYVNEVVLIDARQSVGVSKLPQSDGRPSVIIDFGDGSSANLLATGHAYRVAGTYTITLTARSSAGGIATTQTSIVVSPIPAANGSNVRVLDDTGNAIVNGASLQAAIYAAAVNNSTAEQEIVLPAGAVFAGPIFLPTSVGNKYITIRSGSLSSLPAGYRVGPGQGGLMPVITAPSSDTGVLAALGTTTPAPVNPPHHYRIQGIHLKKDDESRHTQTLMNVGTDSGFGQTLISKIAHHFIVERCWFDGGASDTSQTTNGLRIYGNSVSVMDSYLGEFRLIGSGVDAAAISLASGEGPYAFQNNTMIATSENFNIAGGPTELNSATISNATTTSATLSNVTNLEVDENVAVPVGGSYGAAQSTIIRSIIGNTVTFDAVPVAPDNGGTALWGATPSYIEFRGNYLYKPLKWRPSDPSWNGINYQVKNLWETKFSRYVVVDGNVMENHWISSQMYAIVLTVRNRNGGESPAAVVREMQFSNNIFRNLANGVSISQADDGSEQGNTSQRTSDITFRNNLFWNVGANWDSHGAQHMLINLFGGPNRLKRIFLLHNTHDGGMLDGNHGVITDFGADGGATEAMWMNNVHPHGGGGFRSNNTYTDSVANIQKFLPPGDMTVWNRNLIVNKGDARYPSSGIYLAGSWPNLFEDYRNGDFTLVRGNRGKGAATDLTDIGVDMWVLKAATRGSISGKWDDTPSTRPRWVTK